MQVQHVSIHARCIARILQLASEDSGAVPRRAMQLSRSDVWRAGAARPTTDLRPVLSISVSAPSMS